MIHALVLVASTAQALATADDTLDIPETLTGSVSAEANGDTLHIACQARRYPLDELIYIKKATYGENCGDGYKNDVTEHLMTYCMVQNDCSYTIDRNVIGGFWSSSQMVRLAKKAGAYCKMEYVYEYECGPRGPFVGSITRIAEEASGKTITIECGWKIIHIRAAIYGVNDCDFNSQSETDNLVQACEGKNSCNYVINHEVIGDPAPGCAKKYFFWHVCIGETNSPTPSPTDSTINPSPAPTDITSPPTQTPSNAPTMCAGQWKESCAENEVSIAIRESDGFRCCSFAVIIASNHGISYINNKTFNTMCLILLGLMILFTVYNVILVCNLPKKMDYL